ncbi:MAG: dTMP kinase [Proteobacteria bacterium]|nr:dTMP kinase [Pseudomonadota bacterium]
MKGQFIVVEGLEGAGKSTAMQTIRNHLKPLVSELIVTREPGGTLLGEDLRKLIKDKNRDEIINPLSELLLLYTARVQHVEEVIKPALARGAWVLCDRFELSTFAYQGGGRELPFEKLQQLSKLCLNGFQPDLTIFLDLSVEEGLKRARKRGEFDRIEQESLDFFKRVESAYHSLLKEMDKVIRIDASLPLKRVQESLVTNLDTFYNNSLCS